MAELNTIFKAEYNQADKKMVITFGSHFIPVLCHAFKLLGLEIDKMILEENVRQELKDRPLIKEVGLKL